MKPSTGFSKERIEPHGSTDFLFEEARELESGSKHLIAHFFISNVEIGRGFSCIVEDR